MTTKDKILKTAFELFVSKGFTDVSIDDVMSRVGNTKAALYYHFESKDILLAQVTEKYLFLHLDELINTMRDSFGTPRERIEIFFQAVIDYEKNMQKSLVGIDMDFRSFFLLFMEGVKKFPPIAKRYALFQSDMRAVLKEILDKGKQVGAVSKNVDSNAMAFLLLASGEGLLLQRIANPKIDIRRIVESSFEFLWRGVAA